MFFWANDDKKNSIDIKTVAGVLEKYDSTPYLLEIITTNGKQVLSYSYKETRDNDANELRRLRDEYRNKK